MILLETPSVPRNCDGHVEWFEPHSAHVRTSSMKHRTLLVLMVGLVLAGCSITPTNTVNDELPSQPVNTTPSSADAPATRRQEDARFGVQQHRAIDGDAAALGAKQSGNCVENAGFARARRTEDGGHPASALEVRIEDEGAKARGCRDPEAHSA